jgi:hypothetical protein
MYVLNRPYKVGSRDRKQLIELQLIAIIRQLLIANYNGSLLEGVIIVSYPWWAVVAMSLLMYAFKIPLLS